MAKTNYRAFYFYESFLDALECIDDDHTWRVACSSILRYGLYGTEPETNDATVNMLFKIVKPNVKVAKQHYNEKVEASKGGRPPKLPHDEMVKMKEEGMTAEEVSRQVGCSERQVYNVWSKDREAQQEEAEVSNTVTEMTANSTTEQDNEDTEVSTGTTAPVESNAGLAEGGNGEEVNDAHAGDDAQGRLPSELTLLEAEQVDHMLYIRRPYQEIEEKYNIKPGTLTEDFWDHYEENKVKGWFEQLTYIDEKEARHLTCLYGWLTDDKRHEKEREFNLPTGLMTPRFERYYSKYTLPAMRKAASEGRNVAGDVTGYNRVNEVTRGIQAEETDETDFDEDAVEELIEKQYGYLDDYPPF